MSVKSSIKTVLTLGKGVARGLPDTAADMDPIELFSHWFHAAEESGLLLPESCALATATNDSKPSVRMVLVKDVDERGFVFYTNYGSRKATELEANPHAALCFHWAVLHRQVRVAGTVARVSEAESADYFASRPKGARLGTWASKQSQPLSGREELETCLREVQESLSGDDVPLPSFWGGYRLSPDEIEFWQGRADRLHDRLLFTRSEDGWGSARLYP